MDRGHTAFSTIALAGRATDPRVSEAMLSLARHLLDRERKVRAVASSGVDFGDLAVEHVAETELALGADLLVAVGGDGTMLHAARMAATDDALDGRCLAERRMLLEASLGSSAGRFAALALNDVVVAKGESGRMLDLRTWVDGVYVNTHSGDGFIISTSTGSTAYALSCGGPIVHPTLPTLVLVPICPHTLSDRPIVVGADSVVEIEIADRHETGALVVCDGIVLGELEAGTRLRVARASVSASLLHPPGHDYFRILRSKLHWGRGDRHGQPPAR
jgi:NAD+ kinase